MKKTIIIAILVLMAATTQAQTETKLYNLESQFTLAFESIQEDKLGWFAEVEPQYKFKKPNICNCTETTPFTGIVLGGIALPISGVHLKIGGGYEFSSKESVPAALAAIEHPRFEVAGMALFATEEIGYEFTGTYFFSIKPKGYRRFGLGGGYDTKYQIPIVRLVVRLPISFSGRCSTCPYDR